MKDRHRENKLAVLIDFINLKAGVKNKRQLQTIPTVFLLAAPTLVLRDPVVSAIPGNILWCLATGTPPIYTALLRNNRLLVNSTRAVGIRLYVEYNYTCVATNKYGTDVRKHLIIFVGEALCSDLDGL